MNGPFILGRWYALGMAKSTYLVRWDGGPMITFEMWSKARTGGTVDVSLLERSPNFPYGIQKNSGPWHLVPERYEARIRSHDLSASDRANMLFGTTQVRTLDMGVPWLLDSGVLDL